MNDDQWREQRRAAAEHQGEALARRQASAAAKAQAIIDDFVREAGERGLPTQSLRAKSYSSSASYRTGLTGWYIRRDHSLAIGSDGAYLVLQVPSDILGRFRGVVVAPSDPPLVVGAGGRDGESISIGDLLAIRLADPDGF